MIISSLLLKFCNTSSSFFDKFMCCIYLICSSSFNKSFWEACANVSTVRWFSFGVHILLREILNSRSSILCSLFLKWTFSFTFLMNVPMSFLNCFLFYLLGAGQKFKFLFKSIYNIIYNIYNVIYT